MEKLACNVIISKVALFCTGFGGDLVPRTTYIVMIGTAPGMVIIDGCSMSHFSVV